MLRKHPLQRAPAPRTQCASSGDGCSFASNVILLLMLRRILKLLADELAASFSAPPKIQLPKKAASLSPGYHPEACFEAEALSDRAVRKLRIADTLQALARRLTARGASSGRTAAAPQQAEAATESRSAPQVCPAGVPGSSARFARMEGGTRRPAGRFVPRFSSTTKRAAKRRPPGTTQLKRVCGAIRSVFAMERRGGQAHPSCSTYAVNEG